MTRRVVANHHPLVIWFNRESGAQRIPFCEIAQRAGLYGGTLTSWRLDGVMPSLANFDAVCQVLGYRLVVEKIEP